MEHTNFSRKNSAVEGILDENQIHILAVTETRWKGENINKFFPNHQFFGKEGNGNSGGVGFLISNSVLLSAEFQTLNHKAKNIFSVIIKHAGQRRTGKSSPSNDEASTQWEKFQDEVLKANPSSKTH